MNRNQRLAPALGLATALALLFALALFLGCPGPRVSPEPPTLKPTTPPTPAARSQPKAKAPAIDAGVVARVGQPLQIPVTGTPAPWLEQPIDGEPKRATFTADKVASGARSAIVRTDVGQHVGFHADVGAVGVLVLPAQTIWLGFGTDDAVLAADGNGQLHVAGSLEAARTKTGWLARGRAPKATLWDAAPGVIAASDGQHVWVSTDEGRSFHKSQPVREPIATVLTRQGPTVVLAARDAPGDTSSVRVWISTDGGKRFTRSPLRPDKLTRTGPWVWNESWDCPALLSSDNQTWIEPTDKQVHQAHNTWGWVGALQTTEALDGVHHTPDWATPTYPPVPGARGGTRRIRGANPCPPPNSASDDGGLGTGVLGGFGFATRGSKCTGIGCLRSDAAAASPTTRTGFFLLRDAICAPGKDLFDCPRDKRPPRLPHTAFVDQVAGTIQIAKLPEQCFPVRVWSVRGLGVLLCRSGAHKTDIWVSDGPTTWTHEHTINAAPETVWHVSSASDGTVLLQRSCPPDAGSCSATIRRPVAVASDDAWFDITEQGALTHRPVVGGRVLTVVERDGQAFLSLAASHLEHLVVVRSLAVTGKAFQLTVGDDGKLRIDGRDGDDKAYSRHVGASGEAHPAKRPEPRRTTDGVIIVTPTPFDPSHK